MGKASSIINHAIQVTRNNEILRQGAIAAATLATGGLASGLATGMGAGVGAGGVASGGALQAGAQLASGQGLANISAAQVAAQVAGAAAGQRAGDRLLPAPVQAEPDATADPVQDQAMVSTPAAVSDPVAAERRRKKVFQGRAGTILAGGTAGTSQRLGDASGGQRSNLLGL